MQCDDLDIIKYKGFYPTKISEEEEDTEKITFNPQTVADYPENIQKLAKAVLSEKKLLKRILGTVGYRLGSNRTETKLANYAIMSLFGGGVNTLANGKTGKGKNKNNNGSNKKLP